jgi:quercetin dioxygenase-like cupin family protein
MNVRCRREFIAGAALLVLLAAPVLQADQAAAPTDATVKPLLAQPLADLPGKEAVILEVAYPPGGASMPHRHDAHTFVYVLEGTVEMGVQGKPPVRLEAGGTFYESPTDIHAVSRNASATEPARLLVVFVKNAGAPPTRPAQ